jgi:hypothetical protein
MTDKYKTELCKSWENTGKCRYGHKCQYAHGKKEIRGKKNPKSYKTVLCKNFLNGKCNYGDRCKFAHDKAFVNDKTKIKNHHNYKTKVCINFVLHGKCQYGANCGFIHPPKINKNNILLKKIDDTDLINIPPNNISRADSEEFKNSKIHIWTQNKM